MCLLALCKLKADWSALSNVSQTSVKSIMCRGLWVLWARPPSIEVILLLCSWPRAAERRLLSSRHITADVLSAQSLQFNLEIFVRDFTLPQSSRAVHAGREGEATLRPSADLMPGSSSALEENLSR